MFYNHFYCVPRGWLNEKITHYLIFTRYFAEEKSEHVRERERAHAGVWVCLLVCMCVISSSMFMIVLSTKKSEHMQ